jgi:predicted Zn-dependent protease
MENYCSRQSKPALEWISKMRSRLITIILLCLIVFCAGCLKRRDVGQKNKQTLKGSGVVYLIPLGDFPDATAESLADYYRKRFKIEVKTLPKIELPDTVKNVQRNQLVAEKLVTLLKEARPELVHAPEALVIGLTHDDIYIEHRDWQYAYSWRQEGKYAVASSSRMNEAGLLKEISDEQAGVRFRKVITKNIGLLYYHLPQSDDPRSVLYGRVESVRDLDKMSEDF